MQENLEANAFTLRQIQVVCKQDRWTDSPTVTRCDQKIRETNGTSSLVASASPSKFPGQVQNYEVLQTDQKAFVSPDGNNTVGPQ